jgi:hypothetical protein
MTRRIALIQESISSAELKMSKTLLACFLPEIDPDTLSRDRIDLDGFGAG